MGAFIENFWKCFLKWLEYGQLCDSLIILIIPRIARQIKCHNSQGLFWNVRARVWFIWMPEKYKMGQQQNRAKMKRNTNIGKKSTVKNGCVCYSVKQTSNSVKMNLNIFPPKMATYLWNWRSSIWSLEAGYKLDRPCQMSANIAPKKSGIETASLHFYTKKGNQ